VSDLEIWISKGLFQNAASHTRRTKAAERADRLQARVVVQRHGEGLNFFRRAADCGQPQQGSVQGAAGRRSCETRSRLTANASPATQQFDMRARAAMPRCTFEFSEKLSFRRSGFFESSDRSIGRVVRACDHYDLATGDRGGLVASHHQ